MTINHYINENYNHLNNKLVSAPIFQQRPSDEAIRATYQDIKKLYTDPINIPNLSSIFHLPFDTIQYFKLLNNTHIRNERENLLEAKLKLCNTTANAIYGFSAIANTLTICQEVLPLGKHIATCKELSSIGNIFPFAGIVASIISGTMEMKCMLRQARFISKCKASLKLLEKDPNDKNAFSYLQSFLSNSSEVDKIQMVRLSKRVKPWFAEKLTLELPDALEKNDMPQALTLLKNATIQAEKKNIQHTISLLCNVCLLTACAALVIGAPYTFPFVLFGAVFVLYTINYIFSKGTNQIGWKFSPEYCIPFRKVSHAN